MNETPQSISSDQNPKFKLWKSLLLTKNRKKEGLFLLSGQKIVSDFLSEAGPSAFPVSAVLMTRHQAAVWSEIESKPNGSIFILDTLLFKDLDVLGTDFPIFVCKRPADLVSEQLEMPVGLELGLPLTDPANLGALCRTALSFGVSKVVLTAGSCDPFHPKALRASSGAVLKMNFTHSTKESTNSQSSDFCLDLNGHSIYSFKWPKNIRLWLGEEGQGFKRTFLTQNKITIPIKGMESLNATVAGSIAIFSYSQSFNKL